MIADRVYISTGAFRGKSLRNILDRCIKLDICRLELSSGLVFDPDQVNILRSYKDQIEFLIHNYFPPHRDPFVINLGSLNPIILDRSEAHCKDAIDLCSNYSMPFYSVHAGFSVDPRPTDLGQNQTALRRSPLSASYSRFVESVACLAEYASAQNVRLLVENHVLTEFNLVDGRNDSLLCCSAEEVSGLVRDVAHPNLGLLIDMGHLRVTARTLGYEIEHFMDTVGEHVVALHLSENDGETDSNGIFDGSAWFIGEVKKLPNSVLIIESYDLEEDQLIACRDQLLSALIG